MRIKSKESLIDRILSGEYTASDITTHGERDLVQMALRRECDNRHNVYGYPKWCGYADVEPFTESVYLNTSRIMALQQESHNEH